MTTFIVLSHFTDQGIRGVKESPKRAAAFKAAATKAGVTVKAFYWTLGTYDMVSILEAPNVEAVTAIGLSVGKLGNVRTETLTAFDSSDSDVRAEIEVRRKFSLGHRNFERPSACHGGNSVRAGQRDFHPARAFIRNNPAGH